jgi:adenylate cyclase
MAARLWRATLAWVDSAMATAGIVFMDAWGRLERGYRRPLARVALRLKFAFYPLLACAALAWLGWDWTHERSLDAAEDAIFDQIVRWRPIEPRLSGRTLIVEIDDCSIAHYRAAGDGGWPWSRQRHADLLDQLDRGGVRAVGYDVMFVDPSPGDPAGDMVLEAMAEGGGGRFVFASSRLHPDFDTAARLRAAEAPGTFARVADPRTPGPPVALMLPYGTAMARHSGLANVTRNADGVLRDVPLREHVGDWALPSLPLQVASHALGVPPASLPATVRVNWRTRTRIAYASAADIIEGVPICRAPGEPLPGLRDAVVLVGHTAAGVSDVKPTPVDPAMPGVEVLAEATEALLADSAIRMPPTSLKYLLASALVLLTGFAFWRGEPHEDVDSVFVATNLVLLATAAAGLTFFGTFVDIFAAIGFVGLFFGLCRTYAGIQRGRAIGNNDFLEEFDAARHPWLVMARLRYVPDGALDAAAATRRRREYRRRLRRFLYAGGDAVMIEGIVERKSWLHEILDDLMVLVWKGADRTEALARARRDLDDLHAHLNPHDEPLDVDGMVRTCVVAAEIDDGDDDDLRGERVRLRELLGQDLNRRDEWPLSPANTFFHLDGTANGDPPCQPPRA